MSCWRLRDNILLPLCVSLCVGRFASIVSRALHPHPRFGSRYFGERERERARIGERRGEPKVDEEARRSRCSARRDKVMGTKMYLLRWGIMGDENLVFTDASWTDFAYFPP